MVAMFLPSERKELLDLARDAIKSKLENKELEYIPKNPKFLEPMAAFVTLYKDNQQRTLRGCIGHIDPVQPLWESVRDNAIAAAFYDPRFPPLSKEELPYVSVEISVLSPKKEFKYSDVSELLNTLSREKPGVVLDWGFTRSVFLPQVWKELPDPEQFLANLSIKAGLHPLAWTQAKVYLFNVEVFSDDNL